MLTSSMYERNSSFATNNTNDEDNSSDSERRQDRRTAGGGNNGNSGSNVSNIAYSANNSLFPPPPVRIVETSTADWRMMVVDNDIAASNNHQNIIEDDFEHVMAIQDDDDDDTRGVLILDGVNSIGGPRPAGTNNHIHNNNNDGTASDVLTIPGSDSFPSDPGTINHHQGNSGRNTRTSSWEELESDDDDDVGEGDDNEDGENSRIRPFVRFARRFYRQFWKKGICRMIKSHDFDHHEEDGNYRVHSTRTMMARFAFMFMTILLFAFTLVSYQYYKVIQKSLQQQAEWLEREELMRIEKERLQEEAAMAAALAASLERENEKWKLLHKCSDQNDVGDDTHKYDFLLDDPDEDCNSDSYTFLDNCWFKAKADVRFGHCGQETTNYFKDLWSNLWQLSFSPHWEWDTNDNYDEEALEMYHVDGKNDDDQEQYDDPVYYGSVDDTYYPDHDPLANLMIGIQNAGHFFADRLTELMSSTGNDESQSDKDSSTASNMRQVAADLEDAIHQGFSHASEALSDAMDATRDDMRRWSNDVLSTLSAAVHQSIRKKETIEDNGSAENTFPDECAGSEINEASPEPQSVSRQNLYDAANAISSLVKTWQESISNGEETNHQNGVFEEKKDDSSKDTGSSATKKVRITEMMDDPNSYFEYETGVAES